MGGSTGERVARALLETLDVETEAGRVLMPSAGIYRSVFAWDSGWHYFWIRCLDPGRARSEMEALYACAEASGRLPHETPLPGAARYGLGRRLQLALLSHGFTDSGNSWFIDPPVWLLAAADCAGRDADPERAGKLRDSALRALAWIEAERRAAFLPPPYDAFPAILHPLESGTDFSPAFEAVWGKWPLLKLRCVTSLKGLEAECYSLKGKCAFPGPLVFDPCFLAFYLLGRRALLPGEETESLVEAYWRACFDPETGLFLQKAVFPGRPVESRGMPTFSSVLPLMLYAAGAHRGEARDAFERNALPGGLFWEAELPSFNLGSSEPEKGGLWRGGCNWMNMNFCHASMLKAFGREEELELLVSRLDSRLEAGPSWEYLDPGKPGGGGTEPFSWNGLLCALERGELLDLGPCGKESR